MNEKKMDFAALMHNMSNFEMKKASPEYYFKNSKTKYFGVKNLS